MEHDRKFVMRGLLAAALLAAPVAGAAAAALSAPAARDGAPAMLAEQVQRRDYHDRDLRRGPPPPRSERMGRRPPGPRDRYTWRKGYWVHDGGRWDWRAGVYVERPRPRAVWVADRWVRRGGQWVFVEGHWR